MKFKVIMLAMMLGTASLVGCSANEEEKDVKQVIEESKLPVDNVNSDDVIQDEDTTPAAPATEDESSDIPNAKIDPSAITKTDIEKISSIELFDLDGNKVERTFTDEEIESIISDYNSSVVQDTSYIMMIAGNTMLITLDDGSTISLSSYGNEDYVIAALSNGDSYHLNSSVIGKILLD